jgi:hypothetical protein
MGDYIDLSKSWREYNPTAQLCGADLDGKEFIVTIARFELENVGGGDKKPVAYFNENILQGTKQKGMICGATVSKTLTKLAKSDKLEAWIGLTIQIYPTTEKYKKEDIDVVRVRSFLPKVEQKETLSPDHPKWHDAIKAIAEGRTTLEKVCGRYVITDEHAALINAEVSDIQKERAENA